MIWRMALGALCALAMGWYFTSMWTAINTINLDLQEVSDG